MMGEHPGRSQYAPPIVLSLEQDHIPVNHYAFENAQRPGFATKQNGLFFCQNTLLSILFYK